MNYNFHKSLQDKCHRFLNALEPGTFIPVHHHPDKDVCQRADHLPESLFEFARAAKEKEIHPTPSCLTK